ncbi:MAG: DUF2721 domain-containing protein [Acidobacteria bacterium]|nr:DUF2721 domain-containing protein [Acidobacteriota bacterium]
MQTNEINEVTKVLQISVSPVVLISGIGLLVLSMTNRFARTTDRARALSKEIENSNGSNKNNIKQQIKVLYLRSKILMFSISSAITSIFFVALLVISLFASYHLSLNINSLITLFFILSLIALILSLVLFIKEISLSLKALKLEIKDDLQD